MVYSKGEESASALLTKRREVSVEANINNQSKIVNKIAYNFAPKKVYRLQLGLKAAACLFPFSTVTDYTITIIH